MAFFVIAVKYALMWHIELRPCSLKPPSSCGYNKICPHPIPNWHFKKQWPCFFDFFLNGNFLFSGQRRHDGIGDEEVAVEEEAEEGKAAVYQNTD